MMPSVKEERRDQTDQKSAEMGNEESKLLKWQLNQKETELSKLKE